MLASREIMRLPLDLRRWIFGREERLSVFCCAAISSELVELVERVGDGSGRNVVGVGVVGGIGDVALENMPEIRGSPKKSKHVGVGVIASY